MSWTKPKTDPNVAMCWCADTCHFRCYLHQSQREVTCALGWTALELMFPLGAACWGRCDCGNHAPVCTKSRPNKRAETSSEKRWSRFQTNFRAVRLWQDLTFIRPNCWKTCTYFQGFRWNCPTCLFWPAEEQLRWMCSHTRVATDLCCCILVCFTNSSADSGRNLVWKGTKTAEKRQAIAFKSGPNEVKHGYESTLPFFCSLN